MPDAPPFPPPSLDGPTLVVPGGRGRPLRGGVTSVRHPAIFRPFSRCKTHGFAAFTRRLHPENRPLIAICDHGRVTVGSKALIAAVLAAVSLGSAAPVFAAHGRLSKAPIGTTVTRGNATINVQGVVQSVSGSAVLVRQLDGSTVTVAIDRGTKISVNSRFGKISDVKPGFVLVTTVKAGQPASVLRFLRPSSRSQPVAGIVLLVEDEETLASLVEAYLAQEGFSVASVGSGAAALERVESEPVRLVVLDLNLPDMDGLEVCRRIRARSTVPVVMLTARDEEADRLAGLDAGADDYIGKPFSPKELVARMKAVLRRAEPTANDELLALGDVVVDRAGREVRVAGEDRRAAAEGVRPARLPDREPRRGVLARHAARARLGLRLRGRDADGRRPRRPAPPQARPPRPDPDGPRRRLQGRPAVTV